MLIRQSRSGLPDTPSAPSTTPTSSLTLNDGHTIPSSASAVTTFRPGRRSRRSPSRWRSATATSTRPRPTATRPRRAPPSPRHRSRATSCPDHQGLKERPGPRPHPPRLRVEPVQARVRLPRSLPDPLTGPSRGALPADAAHAHRPPARWPGAQHRSLELRARVPRPRS